MPIPSTSCVGLRVRRAVIAAQVAITLCTVGSPAHSDQTPLEPLPPPALPGPAAAAAPAPSLQQQVAASSGGIQLRIFDINKPEKPRPMRLVRVDAEESALTCDALSPTACSAAPGRYRVTGPGMRATQEFDVGGSAPLDIEVDRGSKAAFYTGIGLAGAGGVLGLTGGVLLALAPSRSAWTGTTLYDEQQVYRLYGWTCIVLGAASLITGVVLMARNSSSTATVTQRGR